MWGSSQQRLKRETGQCEAPSRVLLSSSATFPLFSLWVGVGHSLPLKMIPGDFEEGAKLCTATQCLSSGELNQAQSPEMKG